MIQIVGTGHFSFAIAVATLGSLVGASQAGPIPIPGHSFESPATPFVSINIDFWQKSPKPDWYVEGGGFLWTQLTGIFKNTPAGSADHIGNCDGNQAVWLFAVREVALFQDYDSTDWAHTEPSHAFDARFEPGKSYRLTAGVIGGGGNMLEGASLQVALYYRDGASNQVVIASTNIVFGRALFPTTTHLVDCHAHLPVVKESDPWANQHIGILLRSSVTDTNLEGGYWDLDNIRLLAGPALLEPSRSNGQFNFVLFGEPGAKFELLTSTNAADWSRLAIVTNFTGWTPVADSETSLAPRFYRARQLIE